MRVDREELDADAVNVRCIAMLFVAARGIESGLARYIKRCALISVFSDVICVFLQDQCSARRVALVTRIADGRWLTVFFLRGWYGADRGTGLFTIFRVVFRFSRRRSDRWDEFT